MNWHDRSLILLLALVIVLCHQAAGRTQQHKRWKDNVLYRLKNQDYENYSPLIGVLTQPHTPKHSKTGASQSISGPLVSWIEANGGRVVPIRYNSRTEELEELFKSLNGLVFPGGSGTLWYGHPFFDTAATLWKLAKQANSDGDIFPVYGICLGFETIHILVSNHSSEDVLVPARGQESAANTIELTDSAHESIFFNHWKQQLITEMSDPRLKPTFNAHEWSVPISAYSIYASLDDELEILSTSMDKADTVYVSTVEGKNFPVFATQWHPEKVAYEFSDPTIPHTRTAIEAGYYTGQLLVETAKLNSHKVAYEDSVKLVIQNYERVFIAGDPKEIKKRDPLPDTVWMIPDGSAVHTAGDHASQPLSSLSTF